MQKHILDKLRFKQPLSYTEMLPNNMVSSQFQYHLKSLVTEGLVTKEADGKYRLTHAGEAALEYLSVNRVTPVRMPKVISYTLLTHTGKLLLLRKQKEPYRGMLEPIAGKIHFGEDVSDAAQREVFEKTGLHVERPEFRGVANMTIRKNGELITHMTAYAHVYELPTLPSPLPKNIVIIDAQDISPERDFVPGTPELMQAILSDGQPFVINIAADTPIN